MTKIVLILTILLIQLYAKDENMGVLDIKRSALVLIEYQNEWLAEESKLKFLMKDKEQFSRSKENSKRILEHARNIGMHVVHVPFVVSDDYKELGKGANSGLRLAIQKAQTWQGKSKDFHKDFLPMKNELIVSGRVGTSGFAGSNLDALLKNNDINTLFIIGYATNVCVESTMREAHDKGYHTHVISDATSAFTQEEKEFFEKHIVHHFGKSLTTEAFLSYSH